MWVVRDFSLQLVDDDNNPITSQDYLERALSETMVQNKSHQDALAKNDIRKQLKKYFPSRSCQTLVRPIVNEANLQNLNQMSLEEMRPEFVEATLALRKNVFDHMKPKVVSSSPMDGAMWIELAK